MDNQPSPNNSGLITAVVIIVIILALAVAAVAYRNHKLALSNPEQTGNTTTQTPITNGQIPPVLAVYQADYTAVQGELQSLQTQINALPQVSAPAPLEFGVDLSYANDNVGPQLLQPSAVTELNKQLDALKAMGVTGVHVTMQWPVLSQKYDPDNNGYMDFYKQVAAGLKSRNIKFYAHNTVVFAAPFSAYNHPIPQISFAEYQQEKRTMDENIINQLHPDYLILSSEPSTEAANSGIAELKDPTSMKQLVNFVINGDGGSVGPLNKQGTLVGAGSGTWDSIAFDQNYVTIPNLDFVGLHIYPLAGNQIQNAFKMASVVNNAHKAFIIDEAWEDKAVPSDYASKQGSMQEITKRNVFSFFEPLDQQFITEMTQFAKDEHAQLLSPFWTRNMFAYVDYQPGDENKTYAQLQQEENQASVQALDNNTLSPLGQFYQSFIASNK